MARKHRFTTTRIAKSLRAMSKARPPKGTRWRKPSQVLAAIDVAAATQGVIALGPLADYARKCLARDGDKGNAFLDYAWHVANLPAPVFMGEQDVLAAAHRGEVQAWYDDLITDGWTEVSAKIVGVVTSVKSARASFKKAVKAAKAEEERIKRIGDDHRAQMAASRARAKANTAKLKKEQDLLKRLEAMLPKPPR